MKVLAFAQLNTISFLFNHIAQQIADKPTCWGLVLKCYELRTRQHKMLNVNVLRPTNHYSLGD
jgi:hypothetical protein